MIEKKIIDSGRSKISNSGRPSLLLRRQPPTRRFSVKMYAKTKELDPIGGGGVAATPGSATD